jgi:hypothetical protein
MFPTPAAPVISNLNDHGKDAPLMSSGSASALKKLMSAVDPGVPEIS